MSRLTMPGETFGLTEARDLRSGAVPWNDSAWQAPDSAALPSTHVDVAILGSGIMGAILAERLSEEGRSVTLFDRRTPGFGSTAASTAQVMWEMDLPMVQLAQTIGEQEASRRWKRVFKAVRRFDERLDRLVPDLERTSPTLYLAGDLLDPAGLQQEAEMRRRAGLPCEYLEPAAVADRFGIAPRAGIVSSGSLEIDPVQVCHGLLQQTVRRGGRVVYPVDIVALHPVRDGVELEAADGRTVLASDVIVATGYERARMFLPPAFSLLSTFAIATAPGTAPLWRERAMIWEAADPYLYVREGKDRRIIAGGEDIEQADAATRDEVLQTKAGTIAAKLEAMLGVQDLQVDRAWAATFGASPDGLPAIGRSQIMEHVWLAAGYGGNGIAFAALAAEILQGALQGKPDPDQECFDPYRFPG